MRWARWKPPTCANPDRDRAKSAGYAFPEGKFGTLPASNGVSRLTRIVGTRWARSRVMANSGLMLGPEYLAGMDTSPVASAKAVRIEAHELREQPP